MNKINFIIKPFNKLTTLEFFRLEQLRFDVFVTEQKITEADLDEQDLTSWHVFGTNQDGKVVAVARFFFENNRLMVGRVAVNKNFRRHHLGQQMMIAIEDYVSKNQLSKQIYLHAQVYIKQFYEQLGYHTVGDVFDEAGVDHIMMVKEI